VATGISRFLFLQWTYGLYTSIHIIHPFTSKLSHVVSGPRKNVHTKLCLICAMFHY
jgi:hypothetical protein